MALTRDMRREAAYAKARHELARLLEARLVVEGDACSPILLAKGEAGKAEVSGGRLLTGADGRALRAALGRLGYAPEDWCALALWKTDGSTMSSGELRLALAALGPATLVVLDEAAATLVRESFAEELADTEPLDAAMLAPGYVVDVCGMRVMNLGGFEAALADPRSKQLMWAYLKQIPPLGAPY